MTERGGARRGTDLVVVGDCNPDVLVLGDDVTPSFGQQEKLVEGIWMVVGGSAAITAVAAARLGLCVELVAAVGADPAGDFMLGQLAREGVGTTAVAVRDGVPTGMTVALSRGVPRVIARTGVLAPADRVAIFQWCAINEAALVDYWAFRIDTDDFLQRLRPISPPIPP